MLRRSSDHRNLCCGWRIVVLPIFPWDFPSCYDSAMSNLVPLFVHFLATLARLLGPSLTFRVSGVNIRSSCGVATFSFFGFRGKGSIDGVFRTSLPVGTTPVRVSRQVKMCSY